MKLTILNLTKDSLSIGITSRTKGQDHVVLLPSATTTLSQVRSRNLKLTITPADPKVDANNKNWSNLANAHPVNFMKDVPYYSIHAADHFPLQVYRCRISRKHHKLLLFPNRSLSSFLSEVPDPVPLSSLLLPGTHDTMAFYGWPVSQCQSLATPLEIQLQSGIRVLDIRLGVVNSRLVAYHGIYPQRTPFQTILSTIHSFLSSPSSCRETIVMSLKQEDFPNTSDLDFSRLVHNEIFAAPGGSGMWFLENRVPKLGEVRGKVVMLSRFGNGEGWENGLEGLGMHPTNWPDSPRTAFIWNCKDTLVRTQDWYNISSFLLIPEKVALSTNMLLPPSGPPMPTLSITFFSAASFPFAFPPTVARGFGWPKLGLGIEGVNARVEKWLLETLSNGSGSRDPDQKIGDHEPRLRGWALMDFYVDPGNVVVPLLVECNFRGRSPGEEGWI